MARILYILLMCVPVLRVGAQVVVEAHVEPAEMLVGEQALVTVKVIADTSRSVVFPYADGQELASGVEIVRSETPDTTFLNNGNRVQLVRPFYVTSFDSALYSLRPCVIVDGDTVLARNTLGLKVSSVPVDTAYTEFNGPYEPLELPFTWTWWMCLQALLLAAVVTGFFLLLRRLRGWKPITRQVVIRPPEPPHRKALAALEAMAVPTFEGEAEKRFYVELADVLRSYVGGRFGIDALELTSAEMLSRLAAQTDAAVLEPLRQLFSTADMVKFAKYAGTPLEAETNLKRARSFIEETKPDEASLPKPEVRTVVLGEVKQRNLRRLLIVADALLALAATAMLVCLALDVAGNFL